MLDDSRASNEGSPNSGSMIGFWIAVTFVVSAPFWLGVHLCSPTEQPPGGSSRQFERLLEGATVWNEWRESHPHARVRLSGFKINDVSLREFNLYSATLLRCEMTEVDLSRSILVGANACSSRMVSTDLSEVDAREAQFHSADLTGADLSGSDLTRAGFVDSRLVGANLNEADLSGANLLYANLQDVENWQYITGIRCANIYGVDAPRGFREWAISHGALEYKREDLDTWLVRREDCLELVGQDGLVGGEAMK